MKYRKQIVFLGEVEIPEDSYYGLHTQRALQNFQISNSKISNHNISIEALIITKKACVLANKEIRTKPKDKTDF